MTVRQPIGGIKRECTFQKQQRSRYLFRHSRLNVELSAQDKIIGVEAVRALAARAGPRTWAS